MARSISRSAAAALLTLVGLPGCGSSAKLSMAQRAAKLRHPRVPTVDVEHGKALVAAGATWVDVRTASERSVSRIPGAIDAEQVLADPEAFDGQVLVAYCTVGVRSADWAAARRSEGLDVRNLEGSVMAWARAGEVFEGPNGPTKRVHTWSEGFDWLPEEYEGTTLPPLPDTK